MHEQANYIKLHLMIFKHQPYTQTRTIFSKNYWLLNYYFKWVNDNFKAKNDLCNSIKKNKSKLETEQSV